VNKTQSDKKNSQACNLTRRRAVKTIVGGVSALSAYHMIPVRWEHPLVEHIILPAHGATSGITISDPCAIIILAGDTASSQVIIRVEGFVNPPIGNLSVSIEAIPIGGTGSAVQVDTVTGEEGTFSSDLTLTGGPGITSVTVTTTVQGAADTATCTAVFTSDPPPDPPPDPISAEIVCADLIVEPRKFGRVDEIDVTISGRVSTSDGSIIEGELVNVFLEEIASVSDNGFKQVTTSGNLIDLPINDNNEFGATLTLTQLYDGSGFIRVIFRTLQFSFVDTAFGDSSCTIQGNSNED
jgi:hypothetical protein